MCNDSARVVVYMLVDTWREGYRCQHVPNLCFQERSAVFFSYDLMCSGRGDTLRCGALDRPRLLTRNWLVGKRSA